jgi:hypothetical protein
MNIKSINKLSALIGCASLKSLEQPRNWLLRSCLICGLTLLPLTLSAEHLVVDGIAASGSGIIYEAPDDSTPALTVIGTSAAGSEGSYTGTNITLSSTFYYAPAAYVTDQGQLTLTGGTITTDVDMANGVYLNNGSFTGSNVNIVTKKSADGGVYTINSSTLTLISSTINTTSTGLQFDSGNATVTLDNSTVGGFIQTWSADLVLSASNGSVINGSMYIDMGDGKTTNITLSGEGTQLNGHVIIYEGSNNTLILNNGSVINGNVLASSFSNSITNITLNGEGTKLNGNVESYSDGIVNNTLTLNVNNGSTLTGNVSCENVSLTLNFGGVGGQIDGSISVLDMPDDFTLTLNGNVITGNVFHSSPTSNLTLNASNGSVIGGRINTENTNVTTVILDNSTVGDGIQATETDLVLSASNGSVINGDVTGFMGSSNTVNITLSGEETQLNGNVDFYSGYGDNAALTLNVNNGSTLVGNVRVENVRLTLGEGTRIDGSVTVSHESDFIVSLNNNTITGSVTYGGWAGDLMTLNVSNGSVIGGAINAFQAIDAMVTLNNSTVGGGVGVNNYSTLTLYADNGSVITGDVKSQGNSILNITLNGEDTELHGNFIQDATSIINLTLNTGALLAGGGELDSLTLANGVTIGYTGDLITVTDSIIIEGDVTFDFSDLTEAGNYDLIDWNGAGTVNVISANYNFTGAGVEGSFIMDGTKLTFNANAVPEPSTYFLLVTGLCALLLAAHHHRRHNARS